YTLRSHDWTLGKYKHFYRVRDTNWNGLITRSRASGTNDSEFIRFVKWMIAENIAELRNQLAHGEWIDKRTAEKLRTAILGKMEENRPGMLHWVVEHLASR